MQPINGNGSLRAHLRILVRPLLASGLLAAFWRLIFFQFDINVGKADETALTNMVVPICAMFHSILAAVVLGKVWDEFKVIRRCLKKGDEDSFRDCVHDRIPMMIHLLLGTMSFIIIGGAMLVEYHRAFAGVVSIGAISFFLVLYWEVATTLDNPVKAPWFAGQIPGEWLKPKQPQT